MSILFEPFKTGNFEIKNRFVRSAADYALSDENGFAGFQNLIREPGLIKKMKIRKH